MMGKFELFKFAFPNESLNCVSTCNLQAYAIFTIKHVGIRIGIDDFVIRYYFLIFGLYMQYV